MPEFATDIMEVGSVALYKKPLFPVVLLGSTVVSTENEEPDVLL